MKAVIYARCASKKQSENSIEGQLKACRQYAERNGYTVIGEYIDRAVSGTTDNRPQFQKMIKDSGDKQFQGVLVCRLDRFARSRADSRTYQDLLKRNGVKVISTCEGNTDKAGDIILNGILEAFEKYYSTALSSRIKHDMECVKCDMETFSQSKPDKSSEIVLENVLEAFAAFYSDLAVRIRQAFDKNGGNI